MNERTESVFQRIAESKEYLIELTTKITEIPAPPFNEDRRAEFIHKKFMEMEYTSRIDSLGNVIAHMDSINKEDIVIISAHLDTVFPEGTDVSVRREGDVLYAPGVCDDSRGLAVMLYLAELAKMGLNSEPVGLVFVATLGEEGIGNLRGVRYLFENEEHADLIRRTRAFVTLDGVGIQSVVNRGIGSRRYKIGISGPGGHSYGAFGLVNPVYPLGALVYKISKWDVPKNPRTTYSIGEIRGGRSVNAIPDSAYILLDTRSEVSEQLDKMQQEIENLLLEVTEEENRSRNKEVQYSIDIIGDRPPGDTSEHSDIVQSVVEANKALGFRTKFLASSTDANIPMSKSIPAISVASVHKAGRAHSLDEYIDAGESSLNVIRRNYLILENMIDKLK